MKKAEEVIYIDPTGNEHVALVKSINGIHAGFVTLVYIDAKAPEMDNIKQVWDVPHMSDPSKNENNPLLPRYVLNCWKEIDEDHAQIPADHPNFDHPYKGMEFAENGAPILKHRPLYDASIAEHQRGPDVAKLLDAAGEAPAE